APARPPAGTPAAAATQGTPAPARPPAGTPAAAAAQGTPAPARPPAGTPAAAAQGATAGAAAAEAAQPAPEVDPKIFQEALKDYFDNKQEQAARKLYAFIESTPPTDENYAWAQYFLARCLIDLNLRHAGAVYLAKVAHERSNPQVLPKTLEALKVLTL